MEVWTDHWNLEYYRKPQNLTRRQADWISQRQECDISLHHYPGRLHGKADFLSQPPNVDKGEHDNQNVVGIPDHMWPEEEFSQDMLYPETTTVRTMIVCDDEDKEKTIQHHPDTYLSGHPGIGKTIELIR